MNKFIVLLLTILMSMTLVACSQESGNNKANTSNTANVTKKQEQTVYGTQTKDKQVLATIQLTVDGKVMIAKLEDNATTRELIKKLPMTMKMENLYSREMCYHFGQGAFPTENVAGGPYQVGDIIYWPPMGSFAIMYKQNGEEFNRQYLGHIESGYEIFDGAGNKEVKLEIVK